MREILFRGKSLGNGDWLEGSLFIDDKGEKHEILAGYVNYRLSWEVDPETVGLYTGLKDKNGKRIFEGDIIQIRFEGDAEPPSKPESWYETGKVIWHDQLHGWYVVFDSPDGIAIQEYDGCDDVFIVGNIHDHPELLGGDNA